MKKIKKPVFKKNQIIVTALAAMIAVAGYLNYAGTSFDSSMLTAGSDSVSESDDSDMTADISAEDIYAQTGKKRKRILPAWMKIMRRRHLQMTVSGRLLWPAVQEEAR